MKKVVAIKIHDPLFGTFVEQVFQCTECGAYKVITAYENTNFKEDGRCARCRKKAMH
jgi:hypothetical protein